MCEAYKRRDELSGVTERADAKIVADDVGTLRKQNVKVGEENQIKSLNVPNNVNDKKDLSDINGSKSVEERLELNTKIPENVEDDAKVAAMKNMFLPSTESALKMDKVQATATKSNSATQGNDRLLLQKGFSKLSMHAMASIESKKNQHNLIANFDDNEGTSKSITASTFSTIDSSKKSIAKDSGGFDFHSKDYSKAPRNVNDANPTIETSAISSTFSTGSENANGTASLVTPNVSATTRTTDTSERQMTLEERIESMLNKSKSNGITDGNKSKAEDTNFGDEADIADLLN